MGLVRKAGGGSSIPAGEKLRFGIVSAEPDEGDALCGSCASDAGLDG